MGGMIALVGGNEFRQYCREMDREIMRASGAEPVRVRVLPTAAVTGPAKAANDGMAHFNALGGQAERLMILNRTQANDAELAAGLEAANVIYFTGGDPNYLLDVLRGSLLLSTIERRMADGATLAGSSAGAMVMGSLMRRPQNREWTAGLGLAQGTATLPHHEGSSPDQVWRQLESQLSEGLTVLGIDAQTGCLGQPGNWRVIGSGQVTGYWAGGWQTYQGGETISY